MVSARRLVETVLHPLLILIHIRDRSFAKCWLYEQRFGVRCVCVWVCVCARTIVDRENNWMWGSQNSHNPPHAMEIRRFFYLFIVVCLVCVRVCARAIAHRENK